MKLHYELQQNYNSNLSEIIKQYHVVDENTCLELIDFFEKSLTFRIDDHRKQSEELQIIGDPRPEAVKFKHILFDLLYPLGERYEKDIAKLCHKDYRPKDKPMTKMYSTGFRSLQIQKYTSADIGYPAVHIEAGPDHVKKYLAMIVFLNNVAGGETVFPMCGTAIEPEQGLVAVWPTGLPFYHCGNKSRSDKYILTSWFEFL